MNICFVDKYFPIDNNYDAGIGKYLSDLTSELTERNKVTIITTSKKPRVIKKKNLTIYAIKYPSTKRESLNFLLHLLKIAIFLPKIINKEKIEIIEFANWEAEGILFTLIPNRVLKNPVLIRLHTPSYLAHKFEEIKKPFSNKLKVVVESLFVNQEENFLTSSTNFHGTLCNRIYNLNKNIEIIPLGIKARPQKKLITNNTKIINILYVGRLEKRKGIDILIKAIPKVLKVVNNARFTIVGRENTKSDWLIDLRNSIQYKFLDRVYFLGYINNLKTLDKLYQNSDICVIPSRYESFGLTVLDAMSYRKTVVASKVGGIPEIITDNKDGVLFNPDSPKELSASLISICKNKSKRRFLSQNAYETVKKKFSLNSLVNKTLIYYQSLANGK